MAGKIVFTQKTIKKRLSCEKAGDEIRFNFLARYGAFATLALNRRSIARAHLCRSERETTVVWSCECDNRKSYQKADASRWPDKNTILRMWNKSSWSRVYSGTWILLVVLSFNFRHAEMRKHNHNHRGALKKLCYEHIFGNSHDFLLDNFESFCLLFVPAEKFGRNAHNHEDVRCSASQLQREM